jgi:putative DNA primase/helicase
MKYKGVDFRGAVELIKPIVGFENSAISQEVIDKIAEKKRRLAVARELWNKAVAITPDCPAGKYLTGRTGITQYPQALRTIGQLPYYEDGKEVCAYPAMVALVSGPGGQLVNVHRTFLTSAGEKAPVDTARRIMPGAIPAGSAVRLGSPRDGKLILAEGLETAISAGQMLGISAAWALINAYCMRTWVPPAQGINHVIIAGDNDASFAGQYSAYCLAQRLVCQYKIPKVEVSIPMQPGKDWNDVWNAGN